MLHLILGRAGSGKTTRICKLAYDQLCQNKRTFIIVPEQQAVDTERLMTNLLGKKPSLSLEILNFKRLCNRIFREYGGLSYNYITKSGRALVMWQTLNELAGMLSQYGQMKNDAGFVSAMLAAVSEFKAYRISPSALELASKRSQDNPKLQRLASKLSDLSLIMADYVALLGEMCDDPADDLTRAAQLLREHSFFNGSEVYFDSFNGFTPQEFEIIAVILRQADNVTLSLCCGGKEVPFENTADTASRLIRLCETLGVECDTLKLEENYRCGNPTLRIVERGIWQDVKTPELSEALYDPNALRFYKCSDCYAECEAVMCDISRRVREGYSYRDFGIIMRGAERYDGIIDTTAEKYNIPLFFSKRTDITSKPLIKLILTAFSIKTNNFATTDVISYFKTGLCGLAPDELLPLEDYAERWGIRGRSSWSREFVLNPRGYTTEPMSDDERDLLTHINTARDAVISKLTAFFDRLDSLTSAEEYSRALYEFLVSLDLPSQLEKAVEKLRSNDNDVDSAEADELEQLWGILVDSLDELCTVVPRLEVDSEIYSKLLGILFADCDIGRIPAGVDEVVAGDASLLRIARKHIYIIGANEGVFPKSQSGAGVLTDSDRDQLDALGLELAGSSEYQAADERFYFYRALASASETLTILWSDTDTSGRSLYPSIGVLRLLALFEAAKVVDYSSLGLIERLEGRSNLLEFIAESQGTKLCERLYAYCASIDEYSDKLRRLDIPLCETELSLSRELSALISSGDLMLTQSRLDSYVLCHFSYYCKYILKLEKREPVEFDAGNIGSFMHKILELFVSKAIDDGKLAELDDDEIDRLTGQLVESYMSEVCGIAPDTNSRLGHLFFKLRRTSKLLCRNIADEFAQSEFEPAFFELPIRFGDGEGKAVEPLEVKLSDGTSAYICGVADRVDLYRHNGKLYVRVIDYKTGSKEFSLDDIAMGLNLQMLLYLFSLWKNGSRDGGALDAIAQDAEVLPAGVLYFSATPPILSFDSEPEPDEVLRMVSDKLSRRGLLLDDKDVLSAMERELSGKYLPIKQKKDGSFSRSDALKSLADFGELLSQIEATIRKIGGELKRGDASAHPIRNKKQDACKYCDMKPVCRISTSGGDR